MKSIHERVVLSGCSNQFTEISRVLFVIKRTWKKKKKNLSEKEDKSRRRSLIRPIKVSGRNGSDVQGFVEPLKDEGPAMAMARE